MPAGPTRPPGFWQVFNRGLSLYERHSYERALSEFLKLLEDDSSDTTVRTHVLRTCRKLVDKLMKAKKLREAHNAYHYMLRICGPDVTNTDRRRLNKLVDTLIEAYPGSGFEHVPLEPVLAKPDFSIRTTESDGVSLLDRSRIGQDVRPRKERWHSVTLASRGTLHFRRNYDSQRGRFGSSLLLLKQDPAGADEMSLVDIGFYRFKAASGYDGMVAVTDDLNMYLCTLGGRVQAFVPIGRYAADHYHVRCVDISPDGGKLLFTSANRVYLMDKTFVPLGCWRTPLNEGWREMPSPTRDEKQRCLSVLELTGEPTKDEIRGAFRKLILRHHPDQNVGNPEANAETRAVIEAFELLAGEKAEEALSADRDLVFYCKTVLRQTFFDPSTGDSLAGQLCMVLPDAGEDWVYSTAWSHDGQTLYLGCYSGKLYCVAADGRVRRIYDCHDTIRCVVQVGDVVLVETDACVFVIEGGSYARYVPKEKNCQFWWTKSGFIQVGTKQLRFYRYSGESLCEMEFKKSIYDVTWRADRVEVKTGDTQYVFAVK